MHAASYPTEPTPSTSTPRLCWIRAHVLKRYGPPAAVLENTIRTRRLDADGLRAAARFSYGLTVSARTVQRALKALADAGLVRKIKTGPGRRVEYAPGNDPPGPCWTFDRADVDPRRPASVLAALIRYGIRNVYPGRSAAFLAAVYGVSRRTVGRALETDTDARQNDTGARQNVKNAHGIKGRLKTGKTPVATPSAPAHKARGDSLRDKDGTAAAGGGPGPWIYDRRALADLNADALAAAYADRRAVGLDFDPLDTLAAVQSIPPPWVTGPGIRRDPGRPRRGRRDPAAPVTEHVPGTAATAAKIEARPPVDPAASKAGLAACRAALEVSE